MLEFANEFLARSAVMVPTMLLIAAGFWWVSRKRGWLRADEPFTMSNVRTWPLAYVLADAILFGLVFSALAATLGDGELWAAASGGLAAFVTLAIGPMMFARLQK